MFLLQAVLLAVMPSIGTYALFAVLAVVISCYGGGFGTTPAFAADYFGNVGQVYGLMFTAWGIAGVVGRQLISYIRDSTGEYTAAFYIIAGSCSRARSSRSSCGRRDSRRATARASGVRRRPGSAPMRVRRIFG
jgi:nitrate/nitrite transporter NarK